MCCLLFAILKNKNFGAFPYLLGEHSTPPPLFKKEIKIRGGEFLAHAEGSNIYFI